MKNIRYFILGALPLLLFFACNSSTDSTTEWYNQNKAVYDQIKADTENWKPLPSDTVLSWPQGVYYHEISKGDGTEHPIQTAKVTVNYKGYFLNDSTRLFDEGGTADFVVNQVVRGFGVALQNMVAGDEWKICIPYHLGYGTSSYTIQAYSTLFFDVKLLAIEQYPK
ncbi:MAG: FKBP-type peptidyl-prolyl cis-trans isomerase [Candidatus Symbiothrix sp.]|jgi:FKBP-type peptidyl-prolyl cis-trans isomerase|nr:FKBP-type peptidyl-prolyl cis-trans isomerase [Candidatus Symbiothrix sp.]